MASRQKQRKEAREKHRDKHPKIEPLNENQGKYIDSIKNESVTFGVGPAGTGKTFIAAALAADMLTANQINKVVLTRPAVEACGEQLGFLPGTQEEKMAPWTRPFMECMKGRMGGGKFVEMVKAGRIEVVPFSFMRGLTFDNSMVLLDEAQNTTPGQMELLLTRIGEESFVVIDGDPRQSDIRGENGLEVAISLAKKEKIQCSVVEFTSEDIVRSDICQEWAEAFANYKQSKKAA